MHKVDVATDPNCSMSIYTIESVMIQESQPAVYCLTDRSGGSFACEDLFIVPDGTKLPPDRIVE